jgi:hypothetical protein
MRMSRLIENVQRNTVVSHEPIFESRTVMSFATAAGLPRGSMGAKMTDQEELNNLYLVADEVVRSILPYALRRTNRGGFASKLESLPPINSADSIRLAMRRIGAVKSNGDVTFSSDSEKAIADDGQMIQVLRMTAEGLTKTYLGARRGKDGDAEAFSMRKIGSEAGTAFGNAIESLVAANPQFGETIKKLVKVKIIMAAKDESPAPYDETGLLPDDFFEDTGSARSIREIAKEIRQDWKGVNFAAKPYLSAMMGLESISDGYGMDSAKTIVSYFLSNASSWRGENAKRIKKELNTLLKRAPAKRASGNFLEDSDSGSHRSLSEIAKEIRQDWQKVNYAAKPYLDAMRTLDSIHDSYYQDDAESIVRYFLSNATSWRGEVAKRVKKELNMMLKSA